MTNTTTQHDVEITAPEAVVRRFIHEILNGGRFDLLDELVVPDYRYHGPDGSELVGPESLAQLLGGFRGAFSDLDVRVETMISRDGLVASTMTLTGTHDGDFDGLPPTGARLALPLAIFSRVVDGRIVEEWEFFDTGAILTQLGVGADDAS